MDLPVLPNVQVFYFIFFLEVVEDPWILFLTTMSLKRIHGSSTTSKKKKKVENLPILEDWKIHGSFFVI